MTRSNKPAASPRISRRRFMGTAAAAAAAPWIIPASAHGADGTVAPSNRINVALSGHGAMGRGHLRRLLYLPETQVVAVCDPDKVRRDEAKAFAEDVYADQMASGAYKGCTAYSDYREMLERENLDALVIATQDHWHAKQSIDAAKAGLDVYCEKPCTLTVEEGKCLVDAVNRYGCVFQNGSQYRSIPVIRHVCDFVRNGGLGKVKAAYTIWGGAGGDGPPYARTPSDFALAEEPLPEGLDWEMWVGPAPMRPYNSRYHRNPVPGVVPWSFCEDFGVAASTGYHSHAADVTQYALGYETSGPVDFIHPSSGEFPTLTYRYDNGVLFHLVGGWDQVKSLYGAVPEDARLDGAFGSVIVGERGWVTSMSSGGPVNGSPEIMEALALDSLNVNIGENTHHGNWLKCIETREKPSSHEAIGHRAAALGHLTVIAYKLGRSLKWDPKNEVFVGDDEANRMLERPMRAPWQITG